MHVCVHTLESVCVHLQYRASHFILRAMTVDCCIILPVPSLPLLCYKHTQTRVHTQKTTQVKGSTFKAIECDFAAMASAMKNDKTFCYLLTLKSIWGDGVSRGSSTLKVMLSNKAPQTPSQMESLYQKLLITVTIHLPLCPLHCIAN